MTGIQQRYTTVSSYKETFTNRYLIGKKNILYINEDTVRAPL